MSFKKKISDLSVVFSLSILAAAVQYLAGISINKILALKYEPGSLAIFGQITSLLGLVGVISVAGIEQGVVRSFAKKSPETIDTEVELIRGISFLFSLITSLFLLFFSRRISKLFFDDTVGSELWVYSFAVGIFFISLYRLNLAILNGLGKIRLYTYTKILYSLTILFLSGLGLMYISLKVGLSLYIYAAIPAAILSSFYIKSGFYLPKLRRSLLISFIDNESKYWHFSIMAIASMIIPNLSKAYTRTLSFSFLGLNETGMIEAMSKMSAAFFGILTLVFTIHFIPEISSIKSEFNKRLKIKENAKYLALPIFFYGFIIALCASFLVPILYTSEYLEAKGILYVYLLGDILRLVSFLFAVKMIGDANSKVFILLELGFNITFVILNGTLFRLGYFPSYVPAVSYASAYVLYLFSVLVLFNRKLI